MSFETSFEDAVVNNNVGALVEALLREKPPKSLVNKLNQVAYKELKKFEFKSIILLLSAIEDVSVDILKVDKNKAGKNLPRLIEAFYDLFVRLSPVEDSSPFTSAFLLHVGVVGTDSNIPFGLRLEAVRTLNTILDGTQKEERRKFSKDHSSLLEQFAKIILNVGDYEMQVALTEALCRMTVKTSREELATKWFANPVFAKSFYSMNDGEFETDCRIFLNGLNSYFGDERRVFSFPCLRVFLEVTELFKPFDENLKYFWVDFNLGSSCISFFVNNAECLLWESIHVERADVVKYRVCDLNEQTILTVYLSKYITCCNSKGKMVQIQFDSKHDILDAVQRVYESKRLQQNVPSDDQLPIKHVKDTVQSDKSPILATADIAESPTENGTIKTQLMPQQSGTRPEDFYKLDVSSNTEVARAKAKQFTIHSSGGSSTHSTPPGKEKDKPKGSATPHAETVQSQQIKYDYTRKKPRSRSRLKILPLSSPSSADELFLVKQSAIRTAEELSASRVEQLFDELKEEEHTDPKLTSRDSGFPDVTTEALEDSVFHQEEPMESTPKVPNEKATATRKRHLESAGVGTKKPTQPERDPESHLLSPRVLFTSRPLEEAAESMSRILGEELASETELGSGVLTAFQTFKRQLREHFLERYKQINAKSLESLADCQKNVTSLLSAVHNSRLVHLEHFQAIVVQELRRLENDCILLKEIERETVNFWQSESQSVQSFCNKQQQRLESLGEPSRREQSSPAQSHEEAAPSVLH
ncbi:hypothetical protein UPYG_G00071790 [Umbra pygmaea]|uniref:Synaptonemal complex protein 2 n=1 Tax=Umbra pygmaea TaxID=75934 RepID=A0ABD0XBR5_UMBPY